MEMENSSCKLSKNTKQRASLFGRVARLHSDVPALQALWMQVDLSNGQKLNVRCQDRPLVDHKRPGAAPRSGLTSECLLITMRMPVSTMATWNGSQGLRDDADDDDRNTICNSS